MLKTNIQPVELATNENADSLMLLFGLQFVLAIMDLYKCFECTQISESSFCIIYIHEASAITEKNKRNKYKTNCFLLRLFLY